MLNLVIKPLPIVISLMTAAGLLMHDTHLDKATYVAVSVPSAIVAVGALEKAMTPHYHTHVDRVSGPNRSNSYRSSLPNSKPPRDDDRRYIQNKKLLYAGGGDAVHLWPSV